MCIRDSRIEGRMQLTEAGQYLYSEIEILVRKEREINFRIDKMKHTFTGTLHIGASTTLSQYVLPETLVRFKNASPQMAISLMSGNTAQIEQEIVTGNLHVAFIEMCIRDSVYRNRSNRNHFPILSVHWQHRHTDG